MHACMRERGEKRERGWERERERGERERGVKIVSEGIRDREVGAENVPKMFLRQKEHSCYQSTDIPATAHPRQPVFTFTGKT